MYIMKKREIIKQFFCLIIFIKLTNDVQENYDEEVFIDRYEKIYDDLGIKDIAIKTAEIEKKQLKKARKNKKMTVPINVKLDSAAGEISFKNEMTLLLIEEDDTE